jgi:hypothetical protein
VFGGCFPPGGRAYFLLLRQKKVAKEKATPGSSPPAGVPCATRNAGRLAKLACGSDNASRLPQAFLRCSAPLMGTQEASRNDGSAHGTTSFSSQFRENKIVDFHRFCRDAFPGPHVERRATELMAEKGRGLSEGRSPEFRCALSDAQHREEVLLGCPRQQRVAQGSRRSRPRSLGSPFPLATFFLAKQEESMPARKAEPHRKSSTTFPRRRAKNESWPASEPARSSQSDNRCEAPEHQN